MINFETETKPARPKARSHDYRIVMILDEYNRINDEQEYATGHILQVLTGDQQNY